MLPPFSCSRWLRWGWLNVVYAGCIVIGDRLIQWGQFQMRGSVIVHCWVVISDRSHVTIFCIDRSCVHVRVLSIYSSCHGDADLAKIHYEMYTGCPRRNVPNFGRVFLVLNYTDISQNTYIQSWTVTEIMAREVWNFDSCYTLTDCQIHIKTGMNMWFL